MKHTHGEPRKLWEKFKLKLTPPTECTLKEGDRVIFKNDAGIEFYMDVIGFSEDVDQYGGFIHLVMAGNNGDGDAWWFPHKPEELRKI